MWFFNNNKNINKNNLNQLTKVLIFSFLFVSLCVSMFSLYPKTYRNLLENFKLRYAFKDHVCKSGF